MQTNKGNTTNSLQTKRKRYVIFAFSYSQQIIINYENNKNN